MNKTARISLSALALASILGVAACGSEAGAPAPSSSTSTSQTAEKSNKASDFAPITVDELPEQWNGSSGWSHDADTTNKQLEVFKFGNYLAYYEKDSSGSKKKHVVVVDGKGERSYVSKLPDGFTSDENPKAEIALQDGKEYLKIIQRGTNAGNDAWNLVILDGNGKEVTNQTGSGVNPFAPDTNGRFTQTVDYATGVLSDLVVPKGYVYVGNFDGEDLFTLDDASAGNGGSITNGKWTMEVDTKRTGAMGSSTTSTGMMSVGKLVQIPSKASSGFLTFDPHTGKKVELGEYSTAKITPVVTSPNGEYVYVDNLNPGVLSLKDGKLSPVAKDLNFTPKSITDSGDVYGVGSKGVMFFNVTKDSEPRVLEGVQAVPANVPSVVSDSGLAYFESVDMFIVKK